MNCSKEDLFNTSLVKKVFTATHSKSMKMSSSRVRKRKNSFTAHLNEARKLFATKKITVADIGTGSGAIAVSFKKEWPEAIVTATDISEGALAIAKHNAKANDADITFLQGDLTAPIAQDKWDIVLSNPPYIAHDEAALMSGTVLDHEPHSALFADEDGLYFYRKLAETLPPLMNKPSLIAVEIGYLQGPAVHKLFQEAFPEAIS